jgi:hypothetical protein
MMNLPAAHKGLTRALITSVAALGLAMAAGTAAQAAPKAATCKSKGSKTVVASSGARVYTKRGPRRPASADPSTVTSLCGSRTGGRPVRLATRAVYSAGTLGFRSVQLAGRFASVITTSDDRGGYSEELEVYDLRARRRTTLITPTAGARFRDVVLMPSGNVAWIQTAQAPGQDPDAEPVFNSFEVRSRQAQKTSLLDSGPGVGPTSLAASGALLYWTNGVRVATARLP